MNVSIAQRLATLRREHGLTQEQLAERLGVSRQAVSKWERTESSPDTDNLIALARLYGVTLDELVYGPAGDGGPEGAASSDADGAAAGDGPAAGGVDVGPDADDAVECSWDDGVRVTSADASVSVGWEGVDVRDHRTGDHVEVGPGGIHVNASDGEHTVRTEEDGSVWIDGEHYDSWADAHRATHGSKPRAFVSRVPYAPLALVGFLGVGLFGHRWDVGGCLLAVIPAWESLCSVANAVVRGKRGRKLRGPVAGLCFWSGISAFLVVGLLTGAWHPAWGLILVGLAASLLVDALWPRTADGTGDAPAE